MALGLYEDSPEACELPHKPIPLAVFLVVEQAIRFAWEMMRQRPRQNFRLDREDEDPVTAGLWERLLDEVFNRNVVPGFDTTLLMKPVREAKVSNFDRSNTELMPDLLIGLLNRPAVAIPSQDWLFIECKPVQIGRAAGEFYCDKGIIRFLRGDYAWAMTSALMVGYASARYRIVPKLTTALRHRRAFRYEQNGRQAPPIGLRHLWLKRD